MSFVGCPRTRAGARLVARRAALVHALLLGLLLVVVAAPTASAARYWCRSDPLLHIDGRLVDVFVSVPPEVLLQVSGPTQVVVTLPEHVDAGVVLAGVGFGWGEQVSIAHSKRLRVKASGVEVWVDVLVPASGVSAQLLVEFAPHIVGLLSPTQRFGQTDQWTRLETIL